MGDKSPKFIPIHHRSDCRTCPWKRTARQLLQASHTFPNNSSFSSWLSRLVMRCATKLSTPVHPLAILADKRLWSCRHRARHAALYIPAMSPSSFSSFIHTKHLWIRESLGKPPRLLPSNFRTLNISLLLYSSSIWQVFSPLYHPWKATYTPFYPLYTLAKNSGVHIWLASSDLGARIFRFATTSLSLIYFFRLKFVWLRHWCPLMSATPPPPSTIPLTSH